MITFLRSTTANTFSNKLDHLVTSTAVFYWCNRANKQLRSYFHTYIYFTLF